MLDSKDSGRLLSVRCAGANSDIKAAVQVANGLISKLSLKEFEAAYSYFAPNWREVHAYDEFLEIARSMNFQDYKRFALLPLCIEVIDKTNAQIVLRLPMNCFLILDGAPAEVVLTFRKVAGSNEWRVSESNVFQKKGKINTVR